MEYYTSTTEKGKKLEDEVAEIYRQLEGTQLVAPNVNMMGTQVDIDDFYKFINNNHYVTNNTYNIPQSIGNVAYLLMKKRNFIR